MKLFVYSMYSILPVIQSLFIIYYNEQIDLTFFLKFGYMPFINYTNNLIATKSDVSRIIFRRGRIISLKSGVITWNFAPCTSWQGHTFSRGGGGLWVYAPGVIISKIMQFCVFVNVLSKFCQ